MKKSYSLVYLLAPFCIWAVAGASDPPKNAPNPAKSGAEQQILGSENPAKSGTETPDGDLILSEECPVGYSIFSQIPETIWETPSLFDSDILRRTRFDNFSGLSEDICRITWWGCDLYRDENTTHDCIEDPMDFEVGFYPDDGTGKPDTLNPLYTLPSVTPTRTPTGQMYGPYGGEDFFWTELNRYDLELDPCVSITEAWFSVKGISSNGVPQDCYFAWVTSVQGDGVHWRLSDGSWRQYSSDLAFCLGGQYSPVYGACCDPSTGNCDYVEYQDCPEGARFEADALCENFDPPCRATVFCEDFTYSLGTFTSYEAGDPAGWQWVYNQGNSAGSAFHNDDNVDCDDWLISPGGYTLTAGDTLMWDHRGNFSEYCDYHGVLISNDYIDGSDPTTATWTELYTGAAPEDAWETESVDLSAFAGETVHIAFNYQGYYADEWWVDNVCVYGTAAPPCVYLPGDCDHDGVPATLPDVIAMIGMYRGTLEHPYECDCPPHGENLGPTADPNGNCIPDELPDVVAEIGIYRGTVEALGCSDCPGSLRLMPSADSPASSGIPSLSTKVKSKAGPITR